MNDEEIVKIIRYLELKFYGIELLLQSILIRLCGEDNLDKIVDIINSEIDERNKNLEDKDNEK